MAACCPSTNSVLLRRVEWDRRLLGFVPRRVCAQRRRRRRPPWRRDLRLLAGRIADQSADRPWGPLEAAGAPAWVSASSPASTRKRAARVGPSGARRDACKQERPLTHAIRTSPGHRRRRRRSRMTARAGSSPDRDRARALRGRPVAACPPRRDPPRQGREPRTQAPRSIRCELSMRASVSGFYARGATNSHAVCKVVATSGRRARQARLDTGAPGPIASKPGGGRAQG